MPLKATAPAVKEGQTRARLHIRHHDVEGTRETKGSTGLSSPRVPAAALQVLPKPPAPLTSSGVGTKLGEQHKVAVAQARHGHVAAHGVQAVASGAKQGGGEERNIVAGGDGRQQGRAQRAGRHLCVVVHQAAGIEGGRREGRSAQEGRHVV